MSLKECNCIKKKVIRHVIDDLESSSDDSNEKLIKAMKIMYFDKFWIVVRKRKYDL